MKTIITNYDSHARDIRHIRDQVFIIEQEISRADEYDDRDSACSHAVVFDGNDAIGTGRIDIEKQGKVGRLAVLKEYRRRGIGRLLMQTIENHALSYGLPRIWLHAQRSAVPFYLALNYQSVDKEFEEAGIPHVVMEKKLE